MSEVPIENARQYLEGEAQRLLISYEDARMLGYNILDLVLELDNDSAVERAMLIGKFFRELNLYNSGE